MARTTVSVGDPTKASHHNNITAFGDADHDWDASTGTGYHNGTIHFETALDTHGDIAIMWWEASDGSLWLLGKTNETGTFVRADAEFYIPTGDIADVPAS